MKPRFEKIDLPFSDWGTILDKFEDRTIFQTPAWLSFIATTQRAEPVFAVLKDDTRTLGYFSGLLVRRLGLKILGSPLPGWSTSYMGMNVSRDVPRRLGVQALIRFAFQELGCVHLEIMDRNLSTEDATDLGIQHRSFNGFEIDLTQGEDQLFANMTSPCRRCIRKAQKTGVTIEESHGEAFADDYYSQLEEVFRKQSLIPTYGIDRVSKLINCIHETGQLLLLRARDCNGRCIATGIFPAMNGTMYFWGGASRRDSQKYRPNEAIQWYAMRYWKARGIRLYDMGGAGDYKKKFGGYRISVPWFRKSKYGWLRPARTVSRQLFDWRQRVIGAGEQFMKRGY